MKKSLTAPHNRTCKQLTLMGLGIFVVIVGSSAGAIASAISFFS